MKSFVTLLLLSQGVPMICAGDEFGRSQKGNNNAWCQDNRIGWLDWSLLESNKDFFRFYQGCIALRKNHPIFRRSNFFTDTRTGDGHDLPEIAWQYLRPGEQNWAHDCHGLAFFLRADAADNFGSDFFIMLNGDRQQTLLFEAPLHQDAQKSWFRIVDTAADSPLDFSPFPDARPLDRKEKIAVAPFGCIVLQSGHMENHNMENQSSKKRKTLARPSSYATV